MIEIVGVPFDLAGKEPGSRLGPIAVRLAGLQDVLQSSGIGFLDHGAHVALDYKLATSLADTYDAAEEVYERVSSRVEEALERRSLPLVIGGDHSIAIGSISAARKVCGEKLGVLWIDAHMDFNTPATSPSGNLHGMPLALLSGIKDAGSEFGPRYAQMQKKFADPPLADDAIVWFGLRDVDPGEVKNMRDHSRGLPITMSDIDRIGLATALERAMDHFADRGTTALWISFDVDSLDPVLAPGTGTAVRGGFTYREGHTIAETIYLWLSRKPFDFHLAGIDVVETNPLRDRNNETAVIVVEWIGSLLGKTVLHGQDSLIGVVP